MKRKKYLLILAGLIVLSGCGSTTAVSENQTDQHSVFATEEGSEQKTIAEIYDEISEAVELVSPVCWEEEFITNYYGIDVNNLEEYVFSMSEEAISAETIIMMKVKDGKGVEQIRDELQLIVEEKKNEMENYLPKQFAIVEQSQVQSKENYVWLVISAHADTITKIIEAGIS